MVAKHAVVISTSCLQLNMSRNNIHCPYQVELHVSSAGSAASLERCLETFHGSVIVLAIQQVSALPSLNFVNLAKGLHGG
jgi:hypothetical protein